MEDSPQRRFATQRVRRTNVTEKLSVSVGQMFATVPMWKICHTMVIGWGRWGELGLGGLKSRGWAGELGWGVGVGGVGVRFATLTPRPQTSDPNPTPQPQAL